MLVSGCKKVLEMQPFGNKRIGYDNAQPAGKRQKFDNQPIKRYDGGSGNTSSGMNGVQRMVGDFGDVLDDDFFDEVDSKYSFCVGSGRCAWDRVIWASVQCSMLAELEQQYSQRQHITVRENVPLAPDYHSRTLVQPRASPASTIENTPDLNHYVLIEEVSGPLQKYYLEKIRSDRQVSTHLSTFVARLQ